MTNKDIARAFRELGEIMELHQENPFKIRSYQNAYMTLRKLDEPLAEMDADTLAAMKGVGKAISEKIRELVDTGRMATLEKYRDMTPEGVREMLQIAGFGPKKVRTVWKDLGIESVGELAYAVQENRLLELKGFGQKTQDDLREKLVYYQRSRHQFHYATLEEPARILLEALRAWWPGVRVEETGALRRRMPTLSQLEFLVANPEAASMLQASNLLTDLEAGTDPQLLRGRTVPDGFPVSVYGCTPEEFGSKQFRYTASAEFLHAFVQAFPSQDFKGLSTEEAVFAKAGLAVLPPELREQDWGLELARTAAVPDLLTEADIRGVVHAHSTYSDGLHSLRDMALHARALGYGYLVITDHSKSAFYANGLSPDRVRAQWAEIDQLNTELAPFCILKGIESDILADGSLDYEEEILQGFEVVIASVHSNLRMDEAKATQRILRAIENPYTHILGHPTGRLLLSRPGYPLDHRRIIDACAEHGVAIELNASPYRLDLDWTWLPYARERGVRISINPDAHSRDGIRDIHFGVLAARKGALQAQECLNTREVTDFLAALRSR